MTLFPLFADLNGRAVLVVGGGAVAERKVTLLLGAGASVDLVAPTLTPELTEHARNGRLRHLARRFAAEQADGRWLVIAATDDAVVNVEVANAAKARRIFVNVVDDAALSSFHVPAVVDRSPLVIAISSGGTAPMLARLARERIETWFDHSWGSLAGLLAKMRSRIRARLPVVNERRRFYDWLLRSPLMQLVQQQRSDEAEQAIAAVLAAPVGATAPIAFGEPQPVGHVTLVGAGPGDPGLVTLHALRALNEADVVLHDRLVSAPILDLARRDAERIDVGKIVGKLHTPQDSIHRLMLTHALAGKRVVRLKGGDPFVFGRGGEEIEFLREHGVPYSIVPGITAAVACAAYAGVPLTHRERAQVVRFATAHRRRQEDESDALSAGGETLAIYMGVAEFANVRDKLYDENLPASTPFAIIENGTRPEQRVFVGTLAELVELATAYEVKAPALLVVGDVAQIAAGHHWFGAPPVVTTAPVPDRRAART